jgi:hypothetical protein
MIVPQRLTGPAMLHSPVELYSSSPLLFLPSGNSCYLIADQSRVIFSLGIRSSIPGRIVLELIFLIHFYTGPSLLRLSLFQRSKVELTVCNILQFQACCRLSAWAEYKRALSKGRRRLYSRWAIVMYDQWVESVWPQLIASSDLCLAYPFGRPGLVMALLLRIPFSLFCVNVALFSSASEGNTS